MKGKALKSVLICATAALLATAWAWSALAGDRIYRWIDKSGQENFTDDINSVPEPYRSKFKKEDEQKKAAQGEKKAGSTEEQKKAAPKPASHHSTNELDMTEVDPTHSYKCEKDTYPRNCVYIDGTGRPLEEKNKVITPEAQPWDAQTDTRTAKEKQKADYTRILANLKAELEKKNEEYEYAVKWEMMVRTPKYTQDKLRLMGEIKGIQSQISDYENKLNDLEKPKPE